MKRPAVEAESVHEVKPTAGTLRVIEALAIPNMLVEYEFWCAK